MKRIRQRRSEVEDWVNQLQGEEKVLLRDTREARNASEIKDLLLELLRTDPDIRSELVVSIVGGIVTSCNLVAKSITEGIKGLYS